MTAQHTCDMVEIFPNTVEEAKLIVKEVKAPMIYVNSPGSRKGRPLRAPARNVRTTVSSRMPWPTMYPKRSIAALRPWTNANGTESVSAASFDSE